MKEMESDRKTTAIGRKQISRRFASRSPFRPNGLGLSSARIISIDIDNPEGPVIRVGGADLMDGTPIYDIKPYVNTPTVIRMQFQGSPTLRNGTRQMSYSRKNSNASFWVPSQCQDDTIQESSISIDKDIGAEACTTIQ